MRAWPIIASIVLALSGAGCATSTGGVGPASDAGEGEIDAAADAPDGGAADAAPVDAAPALLDGCVPLAPEELCGTGVDEDCDGQIDEGFEALGTDCTVGTGSCQRTGELVCSPDLTALDCNVAPGPPGTELCGSGVDEDCDGLIDEGFPDLGMPCTAGTGACESSGVYVCNGGGTDVVCNAVPDPATTETCNSIDDDCDGVVDDGDPGGGSSCSTGLMGICSAGTQHCVAGSLVCQANSSATTETCNGLDDDCDGSIDDGFMVGAACDGADLDLCAEGTIACNAAGGTVCSDTSPSNNELCNDVDDDCDGTVDEGFNLGAACDGPDGDLCAEGTNVCNGAGGVMCSDTTTTTSETCNGLDDDCDGSIDEGFATGGFCSAGVGACAASGTYVCSSDGTGVVCNAVPGTPGVETCGDGIDSNCSGGSDACPPNDLASGATDISSGGTFFADLSGAANNATADCAGSLGGRDVYYTFTLPASEVVYFDTFGSDFDTVLRLYSGSCTALGTLQQCIDDRCSTLQTQIATQLGAGTYCLIVDQYSSSWTTGALTLRFTRGGRTGTSITTTSASYTGNTCGNPNATTPECPFSSSAPDLAYWFTMCPTDTRTVTAQTCGGATWDTVVYLRTGAATASPSTACNDDSCGLQSSISASVSGANLYWLIVDGYSTACGSYTLAVTM